MLRELEFHYKSSSTRCTGLSPFEVSIGHVAETELSRQFPKSQAVCPAAVDYLEKREAFCTAAKDNLAEALAWQTFYAKKERRHVEFNVGYLVLLKVDNTSAARKPGMAKKWQPKYIGPFRVKQVMGLVTSKIELPSTIHKTHNVFHASQLRQFNRSKDDNK